MTRSLLGILVLLSALLVGYIAIDQSTKASPILQEEVVQYAVIDQSTSLVVNLILLTSKAVWSPPTGHIIIASTKAKIGDTWNGIIFISPIPEEVVITPEELRLKTELTILRITNPNATEDDVHLGRRNSLRTKLKIVTTLTDGEIDELLGL